MKDYNNYDVTPNGMVHYWFCTGKGPNKVESYISFLTKCNMVTSITTRKAGQYKNLWWYDMHPNSRKELIRRLGILMQNYWINY